MDLVKSKHARRVARSLWMSTCRKCRSGIVGEDKAKEEETPNCDCDCTNVKKGFWIYLGEAELFVELSNLNRFANHRGEPQTHNTNTLQQPPMCSYGLGRSDVQKMKEEKENEGKTSRLREQIKTE